MIVRNEMEIVEPCFLGVFLCIVFFENKITCAASVVVFIAGPIDLTFY